MNNFPTLCLNMIVKNESKIITRLFDSVISIIDCYCICDTGSTDNTIEIIEEYFKNKNIPGKIVREPFQTFCHNRNISLQSCLGMSDYILLLDADMILTVKSFNKSILTTSDCFGIIQGSEAFCYHNIRIVKNNGQFKYVGVTHEYIDYPKDFVVKIIEKSSIFINDIGDGGCKNDKFERDIKLLTNGIKEEPSNVRYYFYLANSYHDSGRYNEAIEFYKKRIEFGGWKEEVWYSYYRIGVCYMKQDNMKDALWYWMEGYNCYPERVEGLYEMMKYYRLKGLNKSAFAIYKICKEFVDQYINRDQYLFLHNYIYKSALYYEYTIIAAYNGVKNINNEVVKIMNYHNKVSEVNNLLSNMKFYKDILTPQTKMILDNSINQQINGENTLFYSSSSCLIPNPYKKGYLLNVRYVNYYINEKGNYLHCDKHIITLNRYIYFDEHFNIETSGFFDVEFDGRLYIGVEDLRIFYDRFMNHIKFIGTGYHKNNKIGIVSGIYDSSSNKIIANELNQSFNQVNCEKNWVFMDYNNTSTIIYDWYPLKICKQDISNNTISIYETKPMPNIFSKVRGSTCGFKYVKKTGVEEDKEEREKEEMWFVGHIVSYEQPRHYYHIISIFDNNMNLLRYSAPFKFEGESIEYCLSIIVEDDRVLMNYSTWDRTTRIGIYDKQYIDSIIKYT